MKRTRNGQIRNFQRTLVLCLLFYSSERGFVARDDSSLREEVVCDFEDLVFLSFALDVFYNLLQLFVFQADNGKHAVITHFCGCGHRLGANFDDF